MKGLYQFPGSKTRRVGIKPRPLTLGVDTVSRDYTIQPVQGITPGSKEEYWVALGLQQIGMKFYFQYSVAGGSRVKGGQVVDFWLLTPILDTPLWVNGVYWHSGARAADDAYKVAEVKRIYRGKIYEPIIIWDYEIPSPEVAAAVVKARVGR